MNKEEIENALQDGGAFDFSWAKDRKCNYDKTIAVIQQLLSNGDKVSEDAITSAHMAGQKSAGVDPSWSEAFAYSQLTPTNSIDREALKNFFMWFRENGELYVDKSIEDMIQVYTTHCLSDNNRSKESC